MILLYKESVLLWEKIKMKNKDTSTFEKLQSGWRRREKRLI